MQNRKDFLQTSAALLLGTVALSNKSLASVFTAQTYPPPGLQLFTFFNEIDNDVPGTMKKIADAGYKEIESAFSRKGGFYGMKPKEFSTLLKDLGMSWKSHHVMGAQFKPAPGMKLPTGPDGKPITIPPMVNLTDNMQQLVDSVAEAGIEYMVCANIPINTTADLKSAVTVLNKTDEACKKAGLTFAYHNHDAEFGTVEGQIPYDLFLKETSAKMELDLAWAVKGGKDPVEIFKKHPGRFPLWHVKDLDANRENVLPVGEGTIDYKPIFAAASSAGMKHFFIEHDMPKDAMASITSSMQYLKANIFKG